MLRKILQRLYRAVTIPEFKATMTELRGFCSKYQLGDFYRYFLAQWIRKVCVCLVRFRCFHASG